MVEKLQIHKSTIVFKINLFKLIKKHPTLTFLKNCFKVACRVRVAYLKEQNYQFFTVFLNKFLKHVFNTILKSNNHTWKKIKNKFYVEKNEAQISGFAATKKAPSPWKKYFLKNNFLPAYLCRYDLQNGVQNFFF